MVYEVQLDTFQGPLELLYQLVKKNRIEISEISLAKVTEQYLGYLDEIKEFNLDMASEFMVIASELIEIKVRTLLPRDDDEEEEPVEGDLVQRLKEYHLFKKISNILLEFGEEAKKSFKRPPYIIEEDVDIERELEIDYDLSELAEAYIKAVSAKKYQEDMSHQEEKWEEIEHDKIKIQDKIEEILDIVKNKGQGIVKFSELINNKRNKMEIIVTFLSILELIKMGKIRVNQGSSEINLVGKTG